MHPVLLRLAEIYALRKTRHLTQQETIEMNHCLEWNLQQAYETAKLHELSYQAHLVDDKEWQHEICQRIEKEKKP